VGSYYRTLVHCSFRADDFSFLRRGLQLASMHVQHLVCDRAAMPPLIRFIAILVVAAVLAIVARVQMHSGDPNRLVRAKVARARSDMRAYAIAVQAFHEDHGSYPTTQPLHQYRRLSQKPAPESHADRMTLLDTDSGVSSSPVAYFSRLAPDPFAPENDMPFGYDFTASSWILISAGPDRVYDVIPSDILRADQGSTITRLLHLTYDPTNGALSQGDIWHLSQLP
jgi:hypothetical protein